MLRARSYVPTFYQENSLLIPFSREMFHPAIPTQLHGGECLARGAGEKGLRVFGLNDGINSPEIAGLGVKLGLLGYF